MKTYQVGYIAGVFDLFHVGHLNLIRRAKEHCEYLIVGVLDDQLVIKFKHRPPYIPHEERMEIVRAIRYVDQTVKVDTQSIDKMAAWEKYHYDCLFSGDDWKEDEGWLRDRERLREMGSDICFFPYTQRTSSTQIKRLMTPNAGGRKKILFGAGKYGKAALEYYGEENVLAFADHDVLKIGSVVWGKKVIGMEELMMLMEQYEVVISCRKYQEILDELGLLGIVDLSVFKP